MKPQLQTKLTEGRELRAAKRNNNVVQVSATVTAPFTYKCDIEKLLELWRAGFTLVRMYNQPKHLLGICFGTRGLFYISFSQFG